ncbi:MAG: hypothetical protein Q8L34_05805 [Candidatus Woesearchaeota archaeon]|nr:hypothetical protein [Candidatus Woesearchaeota archaeon]
MIDQSENYKRMQQELMRQIALTKKNKEILQNTLKQWQQQLKAGIIDINTYSRSVQEFLQGKGAKEWQGIYDAHLKKCNEALMYYTKKSNEEESSEETKGNMWSKIGIVGVVLIIFFTFLTLTDNNLTGFFVLNEGEGRIVYEDGFSTEGIRWSEIKGDSLYERCLQVTSEEEFTATKIIGKVTRASEGGDLEYLLRTDKGNEPGEVIKSCEVEDYKEVWKSCTITDLARQKGVYWACASETEGTKDQTYFTIAYRIGGERRTALWTGKDWQRLDRSSYTMKVQFMSNE